MGEMHAVPPTADEARKLLVGDFYGSFRFSQGEVGTQGFLFNALAVTYRRLWTPAGMDAVLPGALEAAEEQALGIAPPVQHRAMLPQKVEAEAAKQWAAFSTTLQRAGAITGREIDFTYGTLRRLMPFWDARQVIYGRYDRATEAETYQSYYRTYVLAGQPTRSEAFDTIFAALRQRQLGAWPPTTLKFLRAAWELRHADEPFYPEKFSEDLKHSSRLTRLGYLSLGGTSMKLAIKLAAKAQKPRTLQTRMPKKTS